MAVISKSIKQKEPKKGRGGGAACPNQIKYLIDSK